MGWDELWIALALMLVIEGVIPFLSPNFVRQLMHMMAEMDNKSIRMSGLVSMIAGVLLLYWVK